MGADRAGPQHGAVESEPVTDDDEAGVHGCAELA